LHPWQPRGELLGPFRVARSRRVTASPKVSVSSRQNLKVSTRARRFPRRTHRSLRARRRSVWLCARRTPRRNAGPPIGCRARIALYATRQAKRMSLDCQCVYRGPMSTAVTPQSSTATPRSPRRLDQQDDLYRHRLRVRWQSHCAALPERELVSVPAREMYYEPVRPLSP